VFKHGKKSKILYPRIQQQIVDLRNKAGKGITELSNEYGVPKGTISTWVKLFTPIQVSDTETISMKEYKALQKKMKELEIENEILKKATAYSPKINS
jgi:transposase